jgi:hypothetical protein
VSSVTEHQLFSHLRDDLSKGVPDVEELERILRKVDELEGAKHTGNYLSKYQEFMNVVAAHITIVAPFIPALTQLLK